MSEERRQYLLNTPREQLTQPEKRLQTVIMKYGSVSNMLAKRNAGDLSLGGYNGGIHANKNKGFGSWEKEKLAKLTKSRKRDIRGRFVQRTDR